MIKEFVTVEELTEKRTPQQLVEWFNYKLEEVSQKDGGKKALRMRKGLCKQFIEEIYPLSIFAGFEFGDRSDILLQPVIGNQNYDVLIFADQLSSSISKLEITLAIANDNYLKREMLQKEGYAPLSGNIQKKGTKNTEIKFESSLGTKSPEDFNEHINLIKKALNRKIEKNYESNTSLLIVFEDIGVGAPREYISEVIRSFIKDDLESKLVPFSAIYLVGSSGKHFYKWVQPRE